MRRFFFKKFLFLFMAIGLITEFDALGVERNLEQKFEAAPSQITPNHIPLGDPEESTNETDKEIDEDDDPSDSQQGDNLQLVSKVNLIHVFQLALYKEFHRELVSPPPSLVF